MSTRQYYNCHHLIINVLSSLTSLLFPWWKITHSCIACVQFIIIDIHGNSLIFVNNVIQTIIDFTSFHQTQFYTQTCCYFTLIATHLVFSVSNRLMGVMGKVRFFTKFLVGGLAFGDDFWSPSETESESGGGAHVGTESDEGGLRKIVCWGQKCPQQQN